MHKRVLDVITTLETEMVFVRAETVRRIYIYINWRMRAHQTELQFAARQTLLRSPSNVWRNKFEPFYIIFIVSLPRRFSSGQWAICRFCWRHRPYSFGTFYPGFFPCRSNIFHSFGHSVTPGRFLPCKLQNTWCTSRVIACYAGVLVNYPGITENCPKE